MGDRGPAATVRVARWEIGDQPQHVVHHIVEIKECSRWEIGDQPQLSLPPPLALPGCHQLSRRVARLVARAGPVTATGCALTAALKASLGHVDQPCISLIVVAL